MLRKNIVVNTVTDEKVKKDEPKTEKLAKPEKAKTKLKVSEKPKSKLKKAATLPPDDVEEEPNVVLDDAPDIGEMEEVVNTDTGEVILRPKQTESSDPGTTLATPAQTSVASYAPNQLGGGAMAELAKGGFEGLELGYGSFPILKLDGETFFIDEEEVKEKTLYMIISQSRAKYIIKEADVEDTENFIYSYDGIVDTKGISVEVFKAKMAEDGCEIEIKTYLEAVAEIVDGPFEGEFVLLSVPPSALKRFAGYSIRVLRKYKVQPNKVVTEISVGKKISKGTKSWNPWKFKPMGLIEDVLEDYDD